MRYYVGNFFYGDDLSHYRTAGSKNGVRRYQNPDGSLTPEGRVHYNRPLPKKKRGRSIVEKLFSRKKKASKTDKPATKDRKKISDASDEELIARTNRLKLENSYIETVKKQKELKSKKKTHEFGKKFADALLDVGKTMILETFKASLKSGDSNKNNDNNGNSGGNSKKKGNNSGGNNSGGNNSGEDQDKNKPYNTFGSASGGRRDFTDGNAVRDNARGLFGPNNAGDFSNSLGYIKPTYDAGKSFVNNNSGTYRMYNADSIRRRKSPNNYDDRDDYNGY